jgi:putative tricarboxylic transport membrane protein
MNEKFKKPDWRSGIFFLCFGLTVCFLSYHLRVGSISFPGPGFMPLVAGAFLTLLSLTLLLTQIFSKEAQEGWDIRISVRNVIIVIGGMWAYAFLLERIGFVLVTFAFVTLLLRFVDPQSWTKSLFGGAAAAAVAFFLFETILKTNLPRTFLGFF